MALGDESKRQIRQRIARSYAGLHALALLAEGDMKRNAPWMDNTGQARRFLSARVVGRGSPVAPLGTGGGDIPRLTLPPPASAYGGVTLDHTLRLQHGVAYGQALETMQAGRLAIVRPTAERYALLVRAMLLVIWSS